MEQANQPESTSEASAALPLGAVDNSEKALADSLWAEMAGDAYFTEHFEVWEKFDQFRQDARNATLFAPGAPLAQKFNVFVAQTYGASDRPVPAAALALGEMISVRAAAQSIEAEPAAQTPARSRRAGFGASREAEAGAVDLVNDADSLAASAEASGDSAELAGMEHGVPMEATQRADAEMVVASASGAAPSGGGRGSGFEDRKGMHAARLAAAQAMTQPDQQEKRPMNVLEYLLGALSKKKPAPTASAAMVPHETLSQWISSRAGSEARLGKLTENLANVVSLDPGASDEVVEDAGKKLSESVDEVKRGFQNDANDMMREVNLGNVEGDAAVSELNERRERIEEVMKAAINSELAQKNEKVKSLLEGIGKKLQDGLRSMVDAVVKTFERLFGQQQSSAPRPG